MTLCRCSTNLDERSRSLSSPHCLSDPLRVRETRQAAAPCLLLYMPQNPDLLFSSTSQCAIGLPASQTHHMGHCVLLAKLSKPEEPVQYIWSSSISGCSGCTLWSMLPRMAVM